MSTPGTIAVYKNGTFIQIYNHFDSYPEYLGKMLLNNYNTLEKAEALIALGDCSVIEKNLNPQGHHTFIKPEKDVTIAYNRDRDENWEDVKPRMTTNIEKLESNEFVYIFNTEPNNQFLEKAWYISDNGAPFTKLVDIL